MEKTVFVAVMKQNDDPRTVKEYLDELQFLAETAGAIGEKRFIQKMEKPNSRTYIGSGKLAEIKAYIEENGFIRVSNIGGISPVASAYQRVIFENGVVGIMVLESGTAFADIAVKKLIVDIGARSRKEA